MSNLKKPIAFLGLLFTLALTGCGQSSANSSSSSSSSYPIYSGDTNPLTVKTDSSFKNTYENGETLNTTGITVYFNDTLLSSTEYNFVSDKANPESSIITSDSYFSSSIQSSTVSFYAAYHDDTTMYVSAAIDVTVTNSKIVTPWVYYTVGAVVIVAIGVGTFLRYKAKKEGRI
ncbi:MAG: hypothetical protein WCS04_03640 [Sphaerochaetaceae bacterium]|jgi:hypothetical protein